MISLKRLAALAIVACCVAGCAKKVSVDAGAGAGGVTGVAAAPGAFLAYEHSVAFEIAPDAIAARVAAVREACDTQRVGACSVLAIEVEGGPWPSGSVTVRVAPAGVEPLVALGAAGANPVQRTTKAEDLADAGRCSSGATSRPPT